MSTTDKQTNFLPIVLGLVLLATGIICGVTRFVLTGATTVSVQTEAVPLHDETGSQGEVGGGLEIIPIEKEEIEEEIATEVVATAEPLPTPTEEPEVEGPAIRGKLVIVDEALVVVDGIGSDSELSFDFPPQPLYTSFIFPAWSPAGNAIAAIGSRGRDSGVYLIDPNNDEPYQDIHPEDEGSPIYLSWSSDEALGYIANGADGIDLWFSKEENAAELALTGTPFFWDWTETEGEILAHIGSATNDNYLQFLDLAVDNQELTYSANLANNGHFQSPSISHDQTYIAYAETVGTSRSVIIHNQTTDEKVSAEHTGSAALAWSPTDNQLAFTSSTSRRNPTFFGRLRLMDTNGNIETLVNNLVLAYFWSPDGKKIAYLTLADNEAPRPEANANIRARANGLVQTQLTDDFIFVLNTIDVATKNDRELGRFETNALIVSQFLPFFDQYAQSHSIWSPDSDAIAFPIIEEAKSIIYVFPLGEKLPIRIQEGSIAFWSHQ